ncbi:AcrB/AcrD/AcrF family protein [Shewanella benthica KT99]|uniref:AcrB/AcrD/AcrF family protein n=1 Tax=Shewanella benthica KT99 TaxID=314608 RepID=A9EHT1_9GAMM|nr:AcrB/AcrD/AcrF family protein [Shewanella benthica KT99]
MFDISHYLGIHSPALPLSMVNQDQADGEGNNKLYINYQVEGRHNLNVTEAMITKMETYLYANKDKFYIDSVCSRPRPIYPVP